MSTQSDAPETLTELALTSEMKRAIGTALESGCPISIAYVNSAGEPELSYRGSTQAFSDTQLAIWVRNPESGLVSATRERPAVALLYGNFSPEARGFMSFRGQARVDDSETTREQVYESAPEGERNLDPERKGIPLIIDLDSVDGFFGGNVLRMRR